MRQLLTVILILATTNCTRLNPTFQFATDDGGTIVLPGADLAGAPSDPNDGGTILVLPSDDLASPASHDLAGTPTASPDLTPPATVDLAGTPPACAHYNASGDGTLWTLAPPAASPTVSASGATVADPRTGLLWQRTTLKSSTDSMIYGLLYEDAVTKCESLVLDGYSDWRLPTLSELVSIVKPGTSPVIDAALFPDTKKGLYWSSSVLGSDDGEYLSFEDGSNDYDGHHLFYARCVRTACVGAALPAPRFTVAGDVVHDAVTGLDWQKTDSYDTMAKSAAASYCASFPGWRVPTLAEVVSLIDFADDANEQHIDPIFAATYASYLTVDGRRVIHEYPALSTASSSEEAFVRCVR